MSKLMLFSGFVGVCKSETFACLDMAEEHVAEGKLLHRFLKIAMVLSGCITVESTMSAGFHCTRMSNPLNLQGTNYLHHAGNTMFNL